MEATLFVTPLAISLKHFSYNELERGFSNRILHLPISTPIFSLNWLAEEIQDWSEATHSWRGHITLILTPELLAHIDNLLQPFPIQHSFWNDEVVPAYSHKDHVLYITFN